MKEGLAGGPAVGGRSRGRRITARVASRIARIRRGSGIRRRKRRRGLHVVGRGIQLKVLEGGAGAAGVAPSLKGVMPRGGVDARRRQALLRWIRTVRLADRGLVKP